MKLNVILLSLLLFMSCEKSPVKEVFITPVVVNGTPLSYLALGDSYTIGEAVAQIESFPYQLAMQLKFKGITLATAPKIIARTGWTTSELQAAITADNLTQKFDFVTLLIGVNNQYRKQSQTIYRKEFKELLQAAIGFAGGNNKRVFVISIPDWGVTPFGGNTNPTIGPEIDAFNAINKAETLALNVSYTDITSATRNAATDLSLVAKDGLHPSGKMYLDWAINVAGAIVNSYK